MLNEVRVVKLKKVPALSGKLDSARHLFSEGARNIIYHKVERFPPTVALKKRLIKK